MVTRFRGNADSLGPADASLVDALRRFFRGHYSPDRIALTIASPAPPDLLEPLVNHLFGFRSPAPESLRRRPPLVRQDDLPQLLQVRSDGVRVLSFWFPVPGASDCPRDASRAYVLSLIDDRWPGALARDSRRWAGSTTSQ